HGLDRARHRSWRRLAAARRRPEDLLAGVFALMRVRNNVLGHTAGERVAQVPHRLGHLGYGRLRLVELLLQAIAPRVKALMELVAECIPLFSCTDLRKRDNLSSSHGSLLVWQDEVTLSCSL